MILGSYQTRIFSPEDKILLDKYIVFLKNVLVKFEVPFDLANSEEQPLSLDHLNGVQLKGIIKCQEILKQLSLVSFKIETCTEYQNFRMIIMEAKNKLGERVDYVNELRESLSKQYSIYCKSHFVYSLDEILPFSSFTAFFDDFFQEDNLSLNQLNFFDVSNIFDQIKLNLIINHTNIKSLVETNQNRVINLHEVISSNEKSLSLVQKEFFRLLCEEYFAMKPQIGKIAHAEIIAPTHPLAERFGISNKENGILTVSLNPVNKVNLKIGDIFYNRSLPFMVITNQETTKMNFFHQLKLNKNTSINLELPIYLNFIKGKLNI